MAKVFIEETTLTAIGDAIRGKTGKTELIDPANMHNEIAAITAGGGGEDVPEEALTLTGDCNYTFASGRWDWFVDRYNNKITTADITNLNKTFLSSKLKKIPFVLNVNIDNTGSSTAFVSTFSDMYHLEECPKIRGNLFPSSASIQPRFTDMIKGCSKVRYFEDLFEPSMLDTFKNLSASIASYLPRLLNFNGCSSLRRIPTWWYKFEINPELNLFPTSTDAIYYHAFSNCNTLDEALDIPVWVTKKAVTSNLFTSSFYYAYRLKDITFKTNNGQPIVANWKNQVIDLSSNVGFPGDGNSYVTVNSNSGITTDKKVNSDETYQALKNDPDWYVEGRSCYKWSRYNHDSAVRTINSLPDTSAYLASTTGTNTIKFTGKAGSNTDGGAINTLTAEEIAVATAKGWTVTLV